LSQAGKLPHLEALFASYPEDFILDGEIVLVQSWVEYRDQRLPVVDFSKAMEVMGSSPAVAVRKQAQQPLTFVAFDCLEAAGTDLRNTADAVRRGVMEEIVSGLCALVPDFAPYLSAIPRWNEWIEEDITNLVALGMEGGMLKDLMAPYREGKRAKAWLKVKATDTEDVVVMGFKPGTGRLRDLVGAIEFGQMRNGKLVHRGHVGTGLSDSKRKEITKDKDSLMGRVMEVKYFGQVGQARTTGEAAFRHPVFVRFRDPGDKAAEDCVWA
jgi:bifunctional non-homologous end joining protein LigD